MDYSQALAFAQAGEDILHHASHGRLERLKEAVEKGGDVNFLRTDQTALFIASARRHPECVAYLIENGADIEAKTRMRWKAIHEASAKNFTEIAQLLIENGAQLDSSDFRGLTPLLAGINAGSEECVKLLLESGASVDISDYDKNSPLHAAVKSESMPILAAVLAKGGDLDAQNSAGQTPAEFAAETGWAQAVQLLEQARRAKLVSPAADQPGVAPEGEGLEGGAVESQEPEPAVSRIGKKKMSRG